MIVHMEGEGRNARSSLATHHTKFMLAWAMCMRHCLKEKKKQVPKAIYVRKPVSPTDEK